MKKLPLVHRLEHLVWRLLAPQDELMPDWLRELRLSELQERHQAEPRVVREMDTLEVSVTNTEDWTRERVVCPAPLEKLPERCCTPLEKSRLVDELRQVPSRLLQLTQQPRVPEAVLQDVRSRKLVTCSSWWSLLWPWSTPSEVVLLRSTQRWELAHPLPRPLVALRLLQERSEKSREDLTPALKESERHRLRLDWDR